MAIFVPIDTDSSVRARLALSPSDRTHSLTIRVSYPGGGYILRGWLHREGLGQDSSVIDHEAPLNTPLRYTVEDELRTVLATMEVTISGDLPLLTEPVWGKSVAVTIQSWPHRSHVRAGKVVEVSDSPFPVIIDGFERAASSTIALIHTDPASAEALEEMLATQSSLRIRPSCPYLEPAWVSVRDRRRGRFSLRQDSAITDTMELLHTGMPSPGLEAIGATLLDLHEAVPTTLQEIYDRWPQSFAGLSYLALDPLG